MFFDIPESLNQDVDEWLAEQSFPAGSYVRLHHPPTRLVSTNWIEFSDETYAVLFKMRWYDAFEDERRPEVQWKRMYRRE